jgi:SAM-dependent methyltransferase
MIGKKMTYRYGKEFFDFVNESSGRSAAKFLHHFQASVISEGSVRSVLDVGCGRGVWAAEWIKRKVPRVIGIDGDYVARDALLIPQDSFQPRDISIPFDLGAQFDLVQCLEVAEHVPEKRADALLDNLVRHGNLIMFSAAIPGQGGEFHVNERPYEYWREKFGVRGFQLFDAIRGCVAAETDIEPWYRYNAFVYANEQGAARLSQAALTTRLSSGSTIRNMAPVGWRVRCAAISLLPAFVVNAAARAKHGLFNRLF